MIIFLNLLPTNIFALADTCVLLLKIIGQVVTVLGSEISENFLTSLSSLIISADIDVRIHICDVLDSVSSNDLSFLTMVMQAS